MDPVIHVSPFNFKIFIHVDTYIHSVRNVTAEVRTPTTPKPLARRRLNYFGDVRTSDLATPQRAKTCWSIACRTLKLKNQQIRKQQATIFRLRKKIAGLRELIEHLRCEQFMNDDAELLTVGLELTPHSG